MVTHGPAVAPTHTPSRNAMPWWGGSPTVSPPCESCSTAPSTRARIRGCGPSAKGIELHGHEVTSLDIPLGLGTGDRVRMAQRPWRGRSSWPGWRRAGCGSGAKGKALRPDVVVVPYLGHFDVHLARAGGSPAARSCSTTWCRSATRSATVASGETSLVAAWCSTSSTGPRSVPPTSWWWTPPPKAPASVGAEAGRGGAGGPPTAWSPRPPRPTRAQTSLCGRLLRPLHALAGRPRHGPGAGRPAG